MMEEQEFPESVSGHPRLISRWLRKLQDWVDGPHRILAFMPGQGEAPGQHEILYISKERYERMLRESRAYYAMRDEIRTMADTLLMVTK